MELANFIKLYEKSFQDNWELPALTDYTNGNTLTYGELSKEIAKLHILFKQSKIKRGDKIALIGRNTPSWVTVFIGTYTYGAIIVPILQEFNANDVQHIVNHSESKLLFTSDSLWESLELDGMKNVRAAISLDSMKVLAEKSGEEIDKYMKGVERRFQLVYPHGFKAENIKYADMDNDKLLVINYTSGTTGFSKGVMLSGQNLSGNVTFGIDCNLHYRGSRTLAFLPMAHAYGCAFDLLTPLAVGSHLTLLGRIPSPKILLKAVGEVKPNLVICVPLILEKIYKKMILPMISTGLVKYALAIPLVDKQVYATIRKKLMDAFGGEFEQIIVGGAPLNAEVEEFLCKIKFPVTVGYGMTECAPLISYTHWSKFIPRSSGRILQGLMKVKVESTDPQNIPGEICVRGTNTTKGYYKNLEATDALIDSEGWLHTGDMGTVTEDGTIFIRGRYKTMILTSNGQNIYPEEIEAKLNNMPFVMESLVLDREGKIVALVYPDFEAMDAEGVTNEQLPEKMEMVRAEVNKLLAQYEKVSKIQLMAHEFEKTPKRSIKRYLYNH
ncbi:MAG: AMP-binding protein [Bacteroidales bacterium]